MAEATNRKVRLAWRKSRRPAKRNEADALRRCHAGSEETQSLDPAGGLG
jgi:hypothetical protein